MTGDWRDIKNDREKYAAYLCSREWSVIREAVRKRSGGVCERCFRNPMNAAHHLTYVRKYAERPEDLQAICIPCHEFTHGKSDTDPRDQWIRSRQFTEFKAGIVSRVFENSLRIDRGTDADQSIGLAFKIWMKNDGAFPVRGIGFTDDEILEFLDELIRVVVGCGTAHAAARLTEMVRRITKRES